MKQSKFSLADVITALTALAFGFICFLGKNFQTLGNIYQSIGVGVLMAALLFGTAYLAKVLKRTSGNFKTCFILEITMLILLTSILFLIAFRPFSHYFNVLAQKQEIQPNLIASITQAENMFVAYDKYANERKALYVANLNGVVRSKGIRPEEYARYGFVQGPVSDADQIRNKMYSIHEDILPGSYSTPASNKGLKEVANAWLRKAKNNTSKFKAGVAGVVNKIETNTNNWLRQLISLSAKREKGEPTTDSYSLSYHLNFDEVKSKFITKGSPNTLSIVLAISSFFLLLFSWIIAKRSSKTHIGVSKEKGIYDIEY